MGAARAETAPIDAADWRYVVLIQLDHTQEGDPDGGGFDLPACARASLFRFRPPHHEIRPVNRSVEGKKAEKREKKRQNKGDTHFTGPK
jgi:hypothetical protein